MAIEIAKKCGCEIINADCFQVYRELNIGTNKPKKEEMKNIKHHLVDCISICDEWDIKKFKDQAEQIIDNSNNTIVIVGGSNLYIDCLLNNYDLSNTKRTNKYSALSTDELYKILENINLDLAKKIGISNRKRLERAIENNGIMNKKNITKYNPFIIFVNPNRDDLYKKINNRVDEMINNGLLDEVKMISKYKNNNALKAIGYKEIIDNNYIMNNAVIDLIKKNTRNYAKRQLTWCRNKFNANIITNLNEIDNVIDEVKEFLNE